MKLTFFGGAGTVTGSKILLETGHKKILIDCGLFQGLKELRLKNWDSLPMDINELDTVFLTHAHLDHCGYLPVLVKNGFSGKIYCTPATKDLTKIILLDSAKIQEEDARRANLHKYTKHSLAKPLYEVKDAEAVFSHFETFETAVWHALDDEIQFKFLNSGHILGSVFVLLKVKGKTILFSGDIGRKIPIILHPFEYVDHADYLVVESTYGNRLHESVSIQHELLKHIEHTFKKGGVLMIPTFSVERAQEIIYLLSILNRNGLLPKISIYLDSPMGVNATEVYFSYPEAHQLSREDIERMSATVQLVSDVDASKAVVNDDAPKIVLAGSGMITGGRILHYFAKYISDAKNSVLIVGYQAEGTRGRALLSGDKELKFFGAYHKIGAEIFKINAFSGHADQSELLDWLRHFKKPPELTFINHGEPHQSQAFKTKIRTELDWKCTVAQMNQEYYLG
ncbi:MAG: MBL fold metallo-hydrolase [Flavobacteriaceae bacterium]|nr:MBL fold metallo-hydrolase [Flavobacteriaceae bacterium]MDZ4147785.1 MBL fold metallo-hydrolase [Flavobacteriaceae bacterium]